VIPWLVGFQFLGRAVMVSLHLLNELGPMRVSSTSGNERTRSTEEIAVQICRFISGTVAMAPR